MKRSLRLSIFVVVVALPAASCGADGSAADTGSAGADFVVQGEETAFLQPTTTTTVAASAAGTPGAVEGATPEFDLTGDTIPQEEESAGSEFFRAVGQFMECLGSEGYTFLGLPDSEGDPTAAANDPGYLDALTTCAAATQIVDKMAAAEDTSSLSAEEIEARNRNFGLLVDCMIGKGWTVPDPVPDDNGILQPTYLDLVRTWGPPGADGLLADGTLDTDDFIDCGFGDTVDPDPTTDSEES